MTLFFAGILLSMIGSLPPGLISLSVAQTAITRTVRAAVLLACGAAFAEFFQAWIAVAMAAWFLQHPFVSRVFQWAAIPVFWSLAVYLFFFAKPPRQAQAVHAPAGVGQFFKGMILSAFNLLAIPYWFAYCGWLRVSGWWPEESLFLTLLFSAGVTLGTIGALLLYVWLGREIVRRSDSVARQANRVVGLIFFALGLKILWGLL